jgi:hypothetical protein
LIVAWLLFPLVMVAVCTGCGVLVNFVSGRRVPGALIVPLGLAVVIVVATLATHWARTASWTTALIVVLALGGIAITIRDRRYVPDAWSLGLGVVTFVVCAAPVLAAGSATFLGFFMDGDPAIHQSLATQWVAHGPSLATVPATPYSSIYSLLSSYIATSYPVGADVAVGALRQLVGQDVAWVFQPYQAIIVALAAVTIDELLRGAVLSRPLRALTALIAATSGLAFAFYLEGSVKEIAMILTIPLAVALVVDVLRRTVTVRSLVPVCVAMVAGFDVYGVAALPWLGIPIATLVIGVAWRSRRYLHGVPSRQRAVHAVGLGTGLVVLAWPVLASASTFLSVANAALGSGSTLGNLNAPLSNWQMLGIWPTGDFRLPVQAHYRVAYALMGVALAAAVLGGIWIVRRRRWGLLLLLASEAVATIYLLERSTPYAASKVMALFSVTVVLTAMLGAVALHDYGRRVEAWALAVLLAAGVLWTNVIAYRHASPAPRARLADLAAIDTRFAGQGPAFYNLFDNDFAVYFTRDIGAAVPYFFSPPAVERAGLTPRTPETDQAAWDPNDLSLSYLESFRLLVTGRSPTLNRPPANFKLAYSGRFYDVWRRSSGPQVLRHIPVSGGFDPPQAPSCQTLRRIAAQASRQHGELAFTEQPQGPALIPTAVPHPAAWVPTNPTAAPGPQMLLLGRQPGAMGGHVRVPRAGRYRVWVEGSFLQPLSVHVGARTIGSVSDNLGPPGQFTQLGTVTLPAGDVSLELVRPRAGLGPLDYYPGDVLGPIVLSNNETNPPLRRVAPSQVASLCGKHLGWVEIIR